MTSDEFSSRSDPTGSNADGPDETPSAVSDPWSSEAVEQLAGELADIVNSARTFEDRFSGLLQDVDAKFQRSARNLLHYLALRNVDRRPLQQRLARLGLSSLGRAEGHVLASLYAVLRTLHRCTGGKYSVPNGAFVGFDEGMDRLHVHSADLLGESSSGRDVRIMVTLSAEAADSYDHVLALLREGMNCARINCARGTKREWARIVANIRRAEEETGQSCRILMDLGGPKLRTGPLEPGPRVVSWEPSLDLAGRLDRPAVVWVGLENSQPPEELSVDAVLPVDQSWLSEVQQNDRITFQDPQGRRRTLSVVGKQKTGCWAVTEEAAHIAAGTRLALLRKQERQYQLVQSTAVGDLPPREQPIVLKTGDTLILRSDQTPGRPAVRDADGNVLEPAVVPCTPPVIFADLEVGEAVKLNDGKITGIIRERSAEAVRVEITQAKPTGSKLREDRSVNLPDSKLRLNSLTKRDLKNLDFVTEHADLVGLSFVREPSDVRALQEQLFLRDAQDMGIMLKIETRRGFQQLPLLLLTAMRSYPMGLMIARGDLAVECGWERLAEVQEEILWLAEAAHVPVVWATQVLESLAKRGLPSRAEITDAAMAQRAECVMLNKGPHILETIRTLDDILQRMQTHQSKKTATLRNLLIARMEG